MKKQLLTIGLSVLAIVSAGAQGTFAFNNYTVVAPILDLYGSPIVDSTGRYMATAAYIVGFNQPTGSAYNPSPSLQIIPGLSASFVGFNGYFAPSQPAIPGQPEGTQVTLVVRAWDTQSPGGATWATSTVRGQSPGFNYTLVSSNTPGPDPVGLQSFRVPELIPEPSTFALAGLGALSLLLFRRRRKR